MKDSQNIKSTLTYNIVKEILYNVCTHVENNIYTFNKISYKRLRLFKKLDSVLNRLRPHYYESKMFYLTRKMNYKTFSTIIRQICKYSQLKILSNIKYLHSSYIIEYTIFIN